MDGVEMAHDQDAGLVSSPHGARASRMSPKPSRPGVRLVGAPIRARSLSTTSTRRLTATPSWLGVSISTQRRMPARISYSLSVKVADVGTGGWSCRQARAPGFGCQHSVRREARASAGSLQMAGRRRLRLGAVQRALRLGCRAARMERTAARRDGAWPWAARPAPARSARARCRAAARPPAGRGCRDGAAC